MNSHQTDDQLISQLREDIQSGNLVLPTLPEIALQIREAMEDPDTSLAAMAKVIGRDPVLSARLIQVANSALLGAARRIESIETAVIRLGKTMVSNLAVGMAMEQIFQSTVDTIDARLRATWQHSLQVAAVACSMSREVGLRPDLALLAGLVHDIGELPILKRAEELSGPPLDEQTLDRILLERHAELGAWILDGWGFPPALVDAVLRHEDLLYESSAVDYTDLLIVSELRVCPNHELDHDTIPAVRKCGVWNLVPESIELACG